MLDKYDRRISDRYKLIDFRAEDFKSNIISDENYFLSITIPTMCGKYLIKSNNLHQKFA